ncbi:MAG: hypothetical protein M4579_001763 [Chaenotheca gracillima]|nr:MAG: hypothetical protein M4579_001763 [Chaenotheca gracillima]
MGDPLSATGSAVGIISLGLAVTQSLVQYYNSYQAYVTDTATTLVSIKDLNALFASIECSVRSIKLAPDKKNRVEECLLSCSFGVKSLQDELTKITRVGPTKTPQSLEQAPTILNKRQRITSRLQTISKRIAYPFRETTLKRLQEIVSRLQANLSLAVATLQIDISEETSTSVDEIKIGVNSLLKSDRGQRILNWLNAPDPSSNYNAACEKKQAHTGKWFLEGEEFKDWKEAANSFAWIHGNPGCGKTVLSSTIIHELLDESSRYRSSAVGYFYFDYNDERKQDVHKCVRSLISHISLRCSDSSNGIPRALDALYSQYDDGHSQPTSDAVLTTLRDLIQDSKHTFIVLDALDECTDIDRLMRLVKEIHEWDIPHLHLLATSRRLEKIERGLRCLTPIQRPIQQNLVNPDIQEYIRYQLHSDSDFEKWPIMIRDEIESALMEKADGM